MPKQQINTYTGVLIADKPAGFTSFDLCAKLRGVLKTRKIGHTGTLDPMATGVMVILLGGATRAADLLPDHDKEYIADFRLGMTTDTLDITGETLTSGRYNKNISKSDIENILPEFTGDIMQLPPMYSAVQVGGRRLYDLARKGQETGREPRQVRVDTLLLESYDQASGEGRLFVSCGKGTYIRSLVADMGDQIGCGGVLTSLRRTKACGFSESEALSLDEICRLAADGEISNYIRPVEDLFGFLPMARVSEAQAVRYRNGGDLDFGRVRLSEGSIPPTHPLFESDGALVRVFDPERMIGIGQKRGENIHPYKRFD